MSLDPEWDVPRRVKEEPAGCADACMFIVIWGGLAWLIVVIFQLIFG